MNIGTMITAGQRHRCKLLPLDLCDSVALFILNLIVRIGQVKFTSNARKETKATDTSQMLFKDVKTSPTLAYVFQ